MATTITWGYHASICPANTDETALLTAGANEEYNGVLRICNQDTVTRNYYVAHCQATGAASADEWLAYNVLIPSQDVPHEYSLHIGNNEEIRVKASVADKISFHFTGEKKVVS